MTSEDQTDRIQQLEKRIEELENKQQLSKLSRRGLLAGVAGVAGLGAMSGSGAAASGQVGTANNRPDVFADTVDANAFDIGSYSVERLDSSTALNTTFTAPFNSQEAYVIRVKTANGGPGTNLTMTFNGVTGNYTYFDLSGTRRTTQKIRLTEFGAFAVTSGYVTISYGVSTDRPGFSSDLISGRWSRIDQMATKGGVINELSAGISSIELSADSTLEVELYRLAV